MRKLYRSRTDSKIAGVCGGIAEYFDLDATLIRILLIVTAIFSAGSVLIVYIIAAFIIPRNPEYRDYYGSQQAYPPRDNWRNPEPPQYGGQPRQWRGRSGQEPHPDTRYGAPRHAAASEPQANAQSGLDAMMEDIEKKAMRKEIEELKARITKFEKDSRGE